MLKLCILAIFNVLATDGVEMESSVGMFKDQTPNDVESMLNILERADQDAEMANLIMNIQQVQTAEKIEESVESMEDDVNLLRRN